MARFPIGVCTWTFGALPLPEIARRCASLGFDGVELLGDLNRYTAREARTVLADYDLQIFSVTPADADLAHPEAGIRRQGIGYYLRLIDFAAELGDVLVSCHGLVGRVAAISDQAAEIRLLGESVGEIAAAAKANEVRLVFEVLNRYETHTIHTGAEAAAFIAGLGTDNLGILLDAYHMNIEEPSPAEAIHAAADLLWLYHAADSNRQALGRGHTDFTAQLNALRATNYSGPIILECTAPGPNPFTPIKDDRSLDLLESELSESLLWLDGFHRRSA